MRRLARAAGAAGQACGNRRAIAAQTSYKNFAANTPGGKELLDKALTVK